MIPPEATHGHQSWKKAFAYAHLITLSAFNYAEIFPLSLPLPSCLEKVIPVNFPETHSTTLAL